MQTQTSRSAAPIRRQPTTSPPPKGTPAVTATANAAPLEGIERLMADALTALGTAPGGDPASVEYASWLRLVRRTTP